LELFNWKVGQHIRKDILEEKRADYGEKIVPTVSAQLEVEFGSGLSQRNLASMVRFAEVFPDPEILHTLRAKLSWSHFVEIIPLKDELQRNFYAEMCRGQMELYLRWLEKYEQQPEENSPLGLILCASKAEEQIELLQLGKSGIRVAAYMTELPPRDLLRKKLHEAIILARARLKEQKQLSLPGD
jgi:hypothetical protein